MISDQDPAESPRLGDHPADSVKTITQISAQKRRKHRVNIFLDGEFWSGAQESIGARIAVGDTLNSQELQDLEIRIAEEDALGWAGDYLSRWPQSTGRFRKKAEARGYGPEVIERVIGLCTEYGFLDDESLASSLSDRAESGGRSRRWLSGKLREKEFDEELSKKIVAEFNEQAAIERAIQHLDEAKMMQRLLSRGFSYQLCREMGVEAPRKGMANEDLEEEAIYRLLEKAWKKYGEVNNKSVAWLMYRNVPDAWTRLKDYARGREQS